MPDPSTARPAFAATVHDRTGALLPGLVRCEESLGRTFDGGMFVLATDETAQDVVEFLRTRLGASIVRAPADGRIGAHRRIAVDEARRSGCDTLMYSDLDHVLRWIEAAPEELESIVGDRDRDLIVVGRGARAMSASPVTTPIRCGGSSGWRSRTSTRGPCGGCCRWNSVS